MNDWSESLRKKKLRVTPQRIVILQTLERLEQQEDHRHLTARDVCEGVQQANLGLNPTTVYRALEDLNQVGLVDLMATGKDQVRFSLRRQEHEHGHLVCRKCNRVQTVSLELFESLQRLLAQQHQFILETHHLTLSGRCVECQAEPSVETNS